MKFRSSYFIKLVKKSILLLMPVLATFSRAEPTFQTSFELMSHQNKKINLKTLQGKYVMVFFGFTHCPSVCPLGLSTISKVLMGLNKNANHVQAIFISVDPERDDAAQIKQFLSGYAKNIIGLYGSEAELKPILKGYRAYSQKIEDPDTDFYFMDHSDLIYVLDTNGKYLTHFSSAAGASEIVSFLIRKISKKKSTMP